MRSERIDWRARAKALIADMEWSGDIHGDEACPWCSARRERSFNYTKGCYDGGEHEPDCLYAQTVADLEGTEPPSLCATLHP